MKKRDLRYGMRIALGLCACGKRVEAKTDTGADLRVCGKCLAKKLVEAEKAKAGYDEMLKQPEYLLLASVFVCKT